MENNIDDIVNDVLKQMEIYDNGYGEPQAYLDADNKRSIEITHEIEGLPKNEEFYSCVVYGTEEDIEKGIANDFGIIERYVSIGLTREDLKGLITIALYCAKNVGFK